MADVTRAALDPALLGHCDEICEKRLAAHAPAVEEQALRLGAREHLIPDFLIGSQPQRQADHMAAIDRGYLRAYLPRLRIIKPA